MARMRLSKVGFKIAFQESHREFLVKGIFILYLEAGRGCEGSQQPKLSRILAS